MLKSEILEKCEIIAHKCGYFEANVSENSLEALKYCIDKNYINGVELDIQLTKDNQLVVIHDQKVDKLSNGRGLVRKMTLEQLRNLDFNGYKIMTLEEALKVFPSDKQMLIEIKRPLFSAKKVIDNYYELIKKYQQKDIITICFVSDVLTYLKSKDNNIKTGILVDKKQFYNLFSSDVDFIFLEKQMVSKATVKYILTKNKRLGIFTLKNKREFENIIKILDEEELSKNLKAILFTTTVPYLIAENTGVAKTKKF